MATLTIVEALKLKKRLNKKLEDLREKIGEYCAHYDNEKPVYGSEEKQKATVDGWVQAHHDIVKKIEDVSIAIQKTNLVTEVEIHLGGIPVKKTISQWIIRRQALAQQEAACYSVLTDRKLRDKEIMASDGKTKQTIRVVRYYDPTEKDLKLDTYKNEPSMIDSKLEVVNATTQLVEDVNIPLDL